MEKRSRKVQLSSILLRDQGVDPAGSGLTDGRSLEPLGATHATCSAQPEMAHDQFARPPIISSRGIPSKFRVEIPQWPSVSNSCGHYCHASLARVSNFLYAHPKTLVSQLGYSQTVYPALQPHLARDKTLQVRIRTHAILLREDDQAVER
jgi:hypothetical protein